MVSSLVDQSLHEQAKAPSPTSQGGGAIATSAALQWQKVGQAYQFGPVTAMGPFGGFLLVDVNKDPISGPSNCLQAKGEALLPQKTDTGFNPWLGL